MRNLFFRKRSMRHAALVVLLWIVSSITYIAITAVFILGVLDEAAREQEMRAVVHVKDHNK